MVYKWYIRCVCAALPPNAACKHDDVIDQNALRGFWINRVICAYCTTRPVCVPGITWTCSAPLLQPQLLRFFSTSTAASAFYRHLCSPPPSLLSTQPASTSCPLSPGLIRRSCLLRERMYRSVFLARFPHSKSVSSLSVKTWYVPSLWRQIVGRT